MIEEGVRDWFLQELDVTPEDFIREFLGIVQTFPYPYSKRIREGSPIRLVLVQMFDAALLGYDVESPIREHFKLEDYIRDDFETDFEEGYVFLHCIASRFVEIYVDVASIRINRGEASIRYRKFLSQDDHDKEKVLKSIEHIQEEYLDTEYNIEIEYDDDFPEQPVIEISFFDESMNYLPDVEHASEIFKRILKT
jgi:hypothetical protein